MNQIKISNIIRVFMIATVIGMGTYLIYLVRDVAQTTDAKIERYLLTHPEVLAEALDNVGQHLRAQEKIAQTRLRAERTDALERNPNDHSLGHPDAPIVIVEFFDYNCGYCKRAFAPLLEAVRANPDVRLVFKEYPILSESSHHAARYASAIEDFETYLAFHTALMNFRGALTRADLDKLLTDMGLDADAIRTRAESQTVRDHLDETKALASQLGIQGTPAFIIGDKSYAGALSASELAKAIELARIRAGLSDAKMGDAQ